MGVNIRERLKALHIAAFAFVLAGVGIVSGVAVFGGQQAQAAGQCVDYIYSRGGVANCIINIQKIINASGVTGQITADGAFGPLTENAVKAFQANRGIAADGVVGVQTWKKLCAVTQAAATAPKQASGCPAPVPTTGWTKVAWGSTTTGTAAASATIYACKIPVTSTTFQIRSKTSLTSVTGTQQFRAHLNAMGSNYLATTANNNALATFTGSTGTNYQLTTSASSRSDKGYAIATDSVTATAYLVAPGGGSVSGIASTSANFGTALSRPLKVSQLINC